MATMATELRDETLPRTEPFPTGEEMLRVDGLLSRAGEFAQMLAMSLERYEGDIDAGTAWHLHVFADGLRTDAERLLEHATEIDTGVTSVYGEADARPYR